MYWELHVRGASPVRPPYLRAGNRVLLQAQHSGVSYSAVLSDLR